MKTLASVNKDSCKAFFKRVTQPIWLCYIGSLFVAFGLYWVVNHIVVPKYLIYCPFDDCIPFIADFGLAYGYWFLYLPVSFIHMLWHRDDDRQSRVDFRHFMQLFYITWGICLIVFIAFPNAIDFRPTPEEIGSYSFCTTGLSGTYSGFDLPNNVLPSLHCASTLAGCVGVLSSDFVRRSPAKTLYYLYYFTWSVLICASTVFVKQHSILDFFASAIIVALLYPLVYKVNWDPVVSKIKTIISK